jgi:hypothetical protein
MGSKTGILLAAFYFQEIPLDLKILVFSSVLDCIETDKSIFCLKNFSRILVWSSLENTLGYM